MDFSKFRTILVETFRKSGEAVNTPVWFAQEGNTLYFRTYPDTGKIKRLKNNLRVRVAGADPSERPATDWIKTTARFLEGDEAERSYQLLDERYGGYFSRSDRNYRERGGQISVVAIDLPPDEE
jgi:PPOX class probable F420-dependent enzyme